MQNAAGDLNGQTHGIGFGPLNDVGAAGGDVGDDRGKPVDGGTDFGFERLAGGSFASAQAGFVGLAGLLLGSGAQFGDARAKLQNIAGRVVGDWPGGIGRDRSAPPPRYRLDIG